jgi:DNA-binding MarR family transcriptional regulator
MRERLVLIAVFKNSMANSPPQQIQDVLQLREIGSPVSIHKAIKSLQASRYVKLNAVVGDGRIKLVALTPNKSQALFERLSNLVVSAARRD